MSELVVPQELLALDPDRVKIMLFRNRSEIEACVMDNITGEILLDRVPITWRPRENKLDYLSVSKIAAYEQCPANFYHQYMSEEGASEDNGNFFTKFGSILHGVVEAAAKYYQESGIIINPLSIYDDVWKEHDLADFPAYLEGKNLIQDYFALNSIDKRPYDTLFVEREWRGQLGGCTFGLILDYAGVYKNNPKKGRLSDYKSNRMPYTPAELDESFQLKVYEIILRRELAPEIEEWESGYEMFRFGFQQCPPRTQNDLDDAEQYIADTWHQIQKDNTWEEKLNNFCGYRKCRFTCKTYQDYLKNPKRYIDAFNIEGADLAEVERQRALMAKYEKVAKTRKDEAAGILKEAIQEAATRGEAFEVDGEVLELYSNPTSSYNYASTRDTLLVHNQMNLLDGCLSISKTKMDAMLKLIGDPALKLQLAACMSTNYAAPYIVKRKGKGKK